ncbi:MAG: peptidoglycan-binding protein [Deltaproteobacteria bacterium]|nr:peptidoglycan-binding protein [Deltaproteobacteria bacterium]
MTTEPPSWGPVPLSSPRKLRAWPRRASLDARFTTVRPRLRPIAAWRLDVGRFEFESSFVAPRAREELADLGTLHRMFPDSPLSLFGHTDPTGDDAYNKILSGRRALALYGALVRDVALWEELWSQPLAGDQWGSQVAKAMLGSLPGDGTAPYYEGALEPGATPELTTAVAAFQEQSPGLAVDGQLGPATRAVLFGVYMDWLCTDDEGTALRLGPEHFLARGADPQRRGDVQGCGEFNPRMVFSQAEATAYAAWDQKDARDEDNSVNRRVVAYLYPAGAKVDPDRWWPCPAARDGVSACRQRLWADEAARRNPTEQRRHFDGDYDTFGCRFYHYFALNTPAETPVTLGRTFALYLHDAPSGPPLRGTFRLASKDGAVVKIMADTEAVLLRQTPTHRARCLEFANLPSGATWTLSQLDADPKTHKPVLMLEAFSLEDFAARGVGRDPEHDNAPIEYAAPRPDAGPTVEPNDDLDWKALSAEWRGDRR